MNLFYFNPYPFPTLCWKPFTAPCFGGILSAEHSLTPIIVVHIQEQEMAEILYFCKQFVLLLHCLLVVAAEVHWN